MPCDRPIHQVCRLLYLMVSLILIYRVKTETLKKEVSKVKDKIHHKKLSSLSKILGSKQNFESNISSKIFEHVLSRRKFWKLILQKIRIRPKMIFRCHFNAIQDRGRHVRNTETQVNFAKVGFPKVGSKVFRPFFCVDPCFSRGANQNSFFHLWWCYVADKCCILGNNMYGFKVSFFIFSKTTFTYYLALDIFSG